MNFKTTILFLLLATSIITVQAKKDTICITMRPSAALGQDIDATISTQNPTTNAGTDVDFFSATWTCGGSCLDRGLIRFDLSSIPATATIVNATLSLFADNGSTRGVGGSPTYGSSNAGWLMRVTSPWAYNTVTWNTQPSTTTTDEVAITQSINTSENYYLNVAQLITDILSSGNNYGFLIMQQNEVSPYQSLIFGSSNNPDTSLHPQLTICYNISTGIKSIKNSSLIQVYPNPAHDKLVFKTVITQDMENYFAEIYNELGQKVRTVKLYPYETTINTSDMPRGLYLYRIFDSNTLIESGKIELQ